MSSKIINHLISVKENIESKKGIYTVLITLALYKSLNPKQDIRRHQIKMKDGFSGRSYDSKYVTPTLRELDLPSMAESGWLTRSLEQPYPYDKNYEGELGKLKIPFLSIVDFIQNNPKECDLIIKFLLKAGEEIKQKNKIEVSRIKNPDQIYIDQIVSLLYSLFTYNYRISGGSKFPVIAFHSIYKILIKEIKRYDGMLLNDLGSHTSSDRTAKTSGDIEIFDKNNKLFEALEIKLDIEINSQYVRRAVHKIIRFNPKRYYILSNLPIKKEELNEIIQITNDLKSNHGCQLIINGLLPTLKYYLRLLDDPKVFLKLFINEVMVDKELKITHKEKLKELIDEIHDL